jgi:acetyl/propionyl-CoA carboxylase alpha subunit
MFKKILIANRGDCSRAVAAAAAQTHAGAAGVMSQPMRLAREARGDRAAGA